jgi:biopolymer transport protein TolQ
MPTLIAQQGTGLYYAFVNSTAEGKAVLLALFVASVFSWSVMVTKFRVLRFARRQNGRFSGAFSRERDPLRLFETGVRFEGSPLFHIYDAGATELCFQLLGSDEVDETFRARL